MSEKEELLAKIKKMPVEDIMEYERVGTTSNFFFNIGGVFLIFLTLVYPSIIMSFFAGVIVLFLAKFSQNVSEILVEIRKIRENKINS